MSQPERASVAAPINIPDRLDKPASWGATLLALGPFLTYPLLFLLMTLLIRLLGTQEAPSTGIAMGITLALIVLLLLALVAGWVKGFPRWVFPYWGFVLLITLYLLSFTGTIFGDPFTGSWLVFIPLLAVAAIGLLWKRGLGPLQRLAGSIWRDWTLLSFAFYGCLPLLLIGAFDEVEGEDTITIVLMLVLAAGALRYMRASGIWQRFAALLAGFSLSWVVTIIYQGLYWSGRQEPWMDEPGTWGETLSWSGRMGATLLLILLAPMLIEALRWVVGSHRPPESA
jgi:hypothetical protein